MNFSDRTVGFNDENHKESYEEYDKWIIERRLKFKVDWTMQREFEENIESNLKREMKG